MAYLPKKRKNDNSKSICVRLCDSFKRTPQNFICPFIRAEESVRVFYRLEEQSLKNILHDAGTAVGLQLNDITWCQGKRESTMDGNIFIEYKSSTEQWDEDTFTKYKDDVKLKLQNVNIQHILLDHVKKKSTLSQPVITEMDFKIHELNFKFQNILRQYQNSAEPDTTPYELETIKTLLQELKERKIQIAVLSHNAVGKSFLLNLLLLVTAESNKKSGEETTIKMSKGIIGNPTVGMVKEGQFEDLPEVIKDFLDEITDEEQDLKKMVNPIYHQLRFTDHEELIRIESSFKSLSGYYTDRTRIDLEPYLLPQKDIFGDHNATTKCVFYLQYGTSFQAKVEYFNEQELQDQLFELVSLEKGSAERTEIVNESMQMKAEQSLKTKFNILTKNAQDTHNEDILHDVLRSISSPEEIELCEPIKEFAGKTELHIGNGKNPAADRLALQKLLKEFTLIDEDDDDDDDKLKRSKIMKQKIASLKKLTVYVPSTLLYGGTEILEMPGTNDSDPLAMSFIQDALDEVDVVLLLSEFGFRLVGQEVRDCLTNSRFIAQWKKDSQEFGLMLASYPEKNQIYQFGAKDVERLEKIMMDNKSKQEEEFQRLNELLYPVPLTPAMRQNVFTATLLPVLHASILSLEGDPHDILENNKGFLKNSGIDLLMKEFDRITIRRKKDIISEIEKRLKEYEANQNDEANNNPEDHSPPKIDTKSETETIDFELERELLNKHEHFFDKMKDEIEQQIKEAVDGKMKGVLDNMSLNAVKKWNEVKCKVTCTAIFNPQYKGRNPSYKIKVDDILFENLKKEESPVSLILKDLIEKLEFVVIEYKARATTLFTDDQCNIRRKVEKVMDCALTRFLGMTRTHFNESNLMTILENLSKENLITHLLKPAYCSKVANLRNMMDTYISKCFHELQTSFSQKTMSFFNERWPTNLAKVMVRLSIPLNVIHSPQPGCTFCGDLRCSLCIYMESTDRFTSKNKNKVYKITQSVTCTTKNVIYLITCKQCKMQYVGQTRKMVRKRFVDHLSRIKCNQRSLLADHFNKDGHSDLSVAIIEEVTNANSLWEREKHWIQELSTLTPAGLNAQS